jgi:predicted transcriptional regulator
MIQGRFLSVSCALATRARCCTFEPIRSRRVCASARPGTLCGDETCCVARALQTMRVMNRLRLGALRRKLAACLARVSRRLGPPALASVPVSAVMLSRLETVSTEQPIEDVVQLLVGGRHDQLPLVADGAVVGVVTRDDVATGLRESGPHAPLAAAPRHDVVIITPSDTLGDVFHRLRAAPDAIGLVVDHGAPVGLLTYDHLVEYIESA